MTSGCNSLILRGRSLCGAIARAQQLPRIGDTAFTDTFSFHLAPSATSCFKRGYRLKEATPNQKGVLVQHCHLMLQTRAVLCFKSQLLLLLLVEEEVVVHEAGASM